MPRRAALLLALIAACGGSASTRRTTPASATAATSAPGPTIAVDLALGLAWPMHAARVVVTIDGAPVLAQSAETRPLPASLPPMSMPEGPHVVAVLVDAALPCDAASAETGTLRLRAMEELVLSPSDHATVRVALRDHGALVAYADRVELALSASGATGPPGAVAPPPATPAWVTACDAKRDPLAHAECVARAGLDAARRDRDIVAVTCRNDLLTRVRAARVAAAAHAGPGAHEAAIRNALARRADALAQEVLTCAVVEIVDVFPSRATLSCEEMPPPTRGSLDAP